ncbi:MAG: LPS assembly lipoprotein LptE [Methylophilales bacterium]|nr:LPS assembly lipoprotein LptE [Methylophilales bacterium]
MRGLAQLSFQTIFIQGSTLSMSKDLRKSLETNGVKVVADSEDAELMLELLTEETDKRILSIGGDGKVSEYALSYQVSFRTRAATNPLWGDVQTVQASRNFSYSDANLLGKADEEVMLISDMQKDAMRELLRRLTAIKLNAK